MKDLRLMVKGLVAGAWGMGFLETARVFGFPLSMLCVTKQLVIRELVRGNSKKRGTINGAASSFTRIPA